MVFASFALDNELCLEQEVAPMQLLGANYATKVFLHIDPIV